MKIVLLKIFPSDDSQYSRNFHRYTFINALDLRIGKGTTGNVHVEHSWQLNIICVFAQSSDEACVLLPLEAMPHASNFFGCLAHYHAASSCFSFSLLAAYWIDLMMFE